MNVWICIYTAHTHNTNMCMNMYIYSTHTYTPTCVYCVWTGRPTHISFCVDQVLVIEHLSFVVGPCCKKWHCTHTLNKTLTHTHAHIHAHIHAHTHTRTHAHTHTRTHAHMYTHTFTQWVEKYQSMTWESLALQTHWYCRLCPRGRQWCAWSSKSTGIRTYDSSCVSISLLISSSVMKLQVDSHTDISVDGPCRYIRRSVMDLQVDSHQ